MLLYRIGSVLQILKAEFMAQFYLNWPIPSYRENYANSTTLLRRCFCDGSLLPMCIHVYMMLGSVGNISASLCLSHGRKFSAIFLNSGF